MDLSLSSFTALFGGAVLTGETVILPALYFALSSNGRIFLEVFATLVLAALTADTAWYLGGRTLPFERLLRFSPFRNRKARIETFQGFFEQHSSRILFLSRFAIGTRAVTQMLAGAYGISYGRYMAINLASLLTWMTLLMSFGFALQKTLAGYIETTSGLYAVFGIFMIIIALLAIYLRRILRKKWLDF